jgi:mannan endo-1,4-beta-mannosidase
MKKIRKYILILSIAIHSNFVFAQNIVLEAENAVLNTVTATTRNSVACVEMKGSGSLTFSTTVTRAGFYKLIIRVSTPNGNKDQDLYLNGNYYSPLKFPGNSAFFDFNAGNIGLKAGANNLEIRASWGWMFFDKITLEPAPLNDYSTTVSSLINPNTTQKTKNVFAYLRSQYGKNIISGQTDYWNELIGIAGKTPVVRAFDMQNYSPHNPWGNGGTQFMPYDDGTVQNAINWYNSTNGKGIVSFQWHWFSPSGGQLKTSIFNTKETTFDVSKVTDPNSQEYKDILRDIDAIAVQLKRLQTAGVPVLWRPLHEAGGKWFWWGAKGPAPCLALYDIMYDRLTNFHALNNLVWVWSTPEADWYPGNSKVDIIGYDSYPGGYIYSSQKAIFNQLYDIVQGKKMIAMTENGPIPNPANCIEDDAMWLYFSSWVNLVASQNTYSHIKYVYAHDRVITLDEVSDLIITGLESKINDDVLTIYPSPAETHIIISDKSINNINLLDAHGTMIGTRSPIEGKIDVSDLNSGMYFIRTNNNNPYIFRFIKQ